MRARVEVLEGPVVDQIAAGEVVERPASVVKELIENALDAGARSITIDLEDGGRRRIRVADDGHGMDPRDARLAIERHATSKLRRAEDLAHITTLGFRGEALPSIASVSRFTLRTRPADAEVGYELHVVGGILEREREAGLAVGTVMDVEDLFFNVPARLKFLKSKATEAGAVYDVALRTALAHPELRLTVTHDGRKVHAYLPSKSREERAALVFAEEELARITIAQEGFSLLAMLGAPERARSGTRWLHLFVNGRPIVDTRLARAVAFAFGSVIPPGKYPIGVVHLDVPTDEVDVNAHPQKTEVRFARGAALFESVTRALSRELGTRAFGGPIAREPDFWDKRLGGRPVLDREVDRARIQAVGPDYEPSPFPAVSAADAFLRALQGTEPPHTAPTAAVPNTPAAPETAGAPAAPASTPRPYETSASMPGFALDRSTATHARSPMRSSTAPTLAGVDHRGFYGSLRFVGQVRRTFLVCEGDAGLFVLDQHAVDERILYHRMRSALGRRDLEVQRLLFPERVELRPEEAELVERRSDDLLRAGLECGRLGATTVAVHTVPSLLSRARPATLLADLIAELAHEADRSFGDALDTAVATMACHAAIRAGDTLAPAECVALLRALDEVDAFAGHCPHGRPVVMTLPFEELEKKLGR